MIYYKETAFLLLLGFAASRFILRCRNAPHAGWGYDRLWDRESRLDLCLTALAVLFLLYYFVEMGIHPSMRYAEDRRRPLVEILLCWRGCLRPPCCTIAVVGWTGFRCRALLSCE